MGVSKIALLALCAAAGWPAATACAQLESNEKYDLKPLVPPVFNLPSNSQMKSGTVGGSQTPYTTAPLSPLRDTTRTQTQPAPGFRLTIPSRNGDAQ
jgi:hypothetical protein